ncbi:MULTISPECIES: ALQxL family class IV lanthipeptide [Microbispora]|nr:MULTISPECIES: ALQxL family class IV lanthipeptide [Microbispora]GLW23007.1 hypothetical protein Mame01_30500 [Microbispora amethystogenes]
MELDITALDMLPAPQESALQRCNVTFSTCNDEYGTCGTTL